MDKPFAIVDGQLYINEAMIGEGTVGMVRITDDRVQVLSQSLSTLSVQVHSEAAARANADTALAARIDTLQASIKPGA
ncbi:MULTISPECIES: hypothetical protein [unclassified Pseudomonas]|uniref:phage tail tip fiber protein n=1 Tax=unclassified Pseudomonas TaxID=196821 RepID=UPI0014739D60|nr:MULTISPECIES: hypothetical protein [unclassified Pseudomonas]NMX91989.1 hypothetical protein [Pseudomonas sp. WS 5086]NMY46929.1 hypothetical protein [Pseudomonas sp. WS 5027]